jgi:KUP system potassium uptake protein
MAPAWALYPLVILAAVATTIASQALITGVFSLTMQAVQNGYSPRLKILHTSKDEFGQIYIKSMNRFLMVGSIALVIAFGSSSNLAAAYGLAVTTTMVITTLLFYVVARERWRWSRLTAGSLCSVFLLIDLAFWAANLLKIIDGGWFPLLVGIGGFTLMTTWKRGRQLLAKRQFEKIVPLTEFLERLKIEKPHRIDGTAIYLNRNLFHTPYALVHIYEHFKAVHSNIILLSVITEDEARIEDSERMQIATLDEHTFKIILRYGYLEQPDVAKDIAGLQIGHLTIDLEKASFMIGRENVYATELPGMALWREKIFAFAAKNEMPATDFFQLPKDRVVEIGVQLAI